MLIIASSGSLRRYRQHHTLLVGHCLSLYVVFFRKILLVTFSHFPSTHNQKNNPVNIFNNILDSVNNNVLRKPWEASEKKNNLRFQEVFLLVLLILATRGWSSPLPHVLAFMFSYRWVLNKTDLTWYKLRNEQEQERERGWHAAKGPGTESNTGHCKKYQALIIYTHICKPRVDIYKHKP